MNTLSENAHSEDKTCVRDPIKVAVIDSGFGFKGLGKDAKLCKYGHKDFSVSKKYTVWAR